MTALPNIQIPFLHLPATAVRVIRTIVITLLVLGAVAIAVLSFTIATDVPYFIVLVAALGAIGLLGLVKNDEEAKKPQFDIR